MKEALIIIGGVLLIVNCTLASLVFWGWLIGMTVHP